jgi:hypothetical protein
VSWLAVLFGVVELVLVIEAASRLRVVNYST